ncbi:MAG: type II toxin-antitoxin system RelE/ParE family toxin [Nitrospirota bacterium]|nr:type II toxin-antitoxin system RelE/ParE family toxin [Nitrospirota bacterium]
MIKSFASKDTERLFNRDRPKRIPADILSTALRKLRLVDAAATLAFLQVPPANRLEPLKGRRKGQHSIRINDQWRICFRWDEGNAYDVEIVDYHRG